MPELVHANTLEKTQFQTPIQKLKRFFLDCLFSGRKKSLNTTWVRSEFLGKTKRQHKEWPVLNPVFSIMQIFPNAQNKCILH